MKVILSFPKDAYSVNKRAVTKLRKVIDCTSWTGSSWISDAFVIEADFQKAAERLGIQREYDGDMLVLNGDKNLCAMFIEAAEEWGAEVELIEEFISVYDPADVHAEVVNFQVYARSHGFSEQFIKSWSALILR